MNAPFVSPWLQSIIPRLTSPTFNLDMKHYMYKGKFAPWSTTLNNCHIFNSVYGAGYFLKVEGFKACLVPPCTSKEHDITGLVGCRCEQCRGQPVWVTRQTSWNPTHQLFTRLGKTRDVLSIFSVSLAVSYSSLLLSNTDINQFPLWTCWWILGFPIMHR